MEKILIAEDSQSIKSALQQMIQSALPFEIDLVSNETEAKAYLETHKQILLVAIINLNFANSKEGTLVDHFTNNKIPTIVLTSTLDEEIRKRLIQKGVLDYIPKDSRLSFEYVTRVIRRLHRSQDQGALIVEDSSSARKWIKNMLQRQYQDVFECSDAETALTLIAQHKQINLVITDYIMPGMDGLELTKQIRKQHTREEIAIIGLSGLKDDFISARFVKNGANDFLKKPFSYEEFLWRVVSTMEPLDLKR